MGLKKGGRPVRKRAGKTEHEAAIDAIVLAQFDAMGEPFDKDERRSEGDG